MQELMALKEDVARQIREEIEAREEVEARPGVEAIHTDQAIN